MIKGSFNFEKSLTVLSEAFQKHNRCEGALSGDFQFRMILSEALTSLTKRQKRRLYRQTYLSSAEIDLAMCAFVDTIVETIRAVPKDHGNLRYNFFWPARNISPPPLTKETAVGSCPKEFGRIRDNIKDIAESYLNGPGPKSDTFSWILLHLLVHFENRALVSTLPRYFTDQWGFNESSRKRLLLTWQRWGLFFVNIKVRVVHLVLTAIMSIILVSPLLYYRLFIAAGCILGLICIQILRSLLIPLVPKNDKLMQVASEMLAFEQRLQTPVLIGKLATQEYEHLTYQRGVLYPPVVADLLRLLTKSYKPSQICFPLSNQIISVEEILFEAMVEKKKK